MIQLKIKSNLAPLERVEMKKIVKNFPLTFYIILFFIFSFIFLFSHPNMDLDGLVTIFWTLILMIFFPMVMAVKNGNIIKITTYIFLLDLTLFYLRKYIIPSIKNKKLLIPSFANFFKSLKRY